MKLRVETEAASHGPWTRRAQPSENGFVLVGVVMLVLALTILGLSLFSLSGYEAQFMRASYQRTQLFYDAMSGVDRTKAILATTGLLESAGSGLPLPGYPSIVFAQASQNGESTGVVKWSPSKHISIRVRAEQPGRPSDNITIRAQFVPQSDQSLYRDLIATPGKIFVYQSNVREDYERGNIFATGRIRNPDPNDWAGNILGSPDPVGGGAPLPNVQDFIREWSPSATAVQHIDGAPIDSYRFELYGARYRIFNGPDRPGDGFGVHDVSSDSITFEVMDGAGGAGTAVWLLPDGASFDRWITVVGSPASNLVIVAGKSTNTTSTPAVDTGVNPGLWFKGGIRSRAPAGISGPGPNLFFVSDGTIALDRESGYTQEYEIRFLAIFAGGVYIRGPRGGLDGVTGAPYYRRFDMTHAANDDAVLNPLYDDNLLPNIKGRNKTFTLVPGSFTETADSNPPN